MRVLFISSWYPTKSNPNFGIFVKEHAHAIKTAGNEIAVLAIVVIRNKEKYYSKLITDFVDENGIRTVSIEINTRFRDFFYHLLPLQYFLAKKVFLKIIQPEFNPDIVHSNVIFPGGIIGDWLSRTIKKPHVITEHWSRLNDFMKKPVLSYLARKAYLNAKCIMPVSEFLKNNIMQVLATTKPIQYQVIGNVIASDTFFYKKKIHFSDTLKFCAVALWVRKKVPDKKPELFIEALSELQKEIKQPISLTMIGGGNKVNKLSRLCREKGINAEFLGYQNKKVIARGLQESDFFVHASRIETFGVVVAEALLCGTPVICSNVGALPELINKSNGVLCENTVEGWVEGLKEAISTSYNHAEISEHMKQKFSLEEIGKQFSSVYTNA